MYLNEKAWEIEQNDPYIVDHAMRNFLDIYSAVMRQYPGKEIYVPEGEELYLRSAECPIKKWLSKTDIEYRRLFLSLSNKMIRYHAEDEYEVLIGGESVKGATEACLNHSFMVSICLDGQWKETQLEGELYSLSEEAEKKVRINNVFTVQQITDDPIKTILERESTFCVYSYEELWRRKDEIFPHLSFCPSVEDNLDRLEKFYMDQVIKKLLELEQYCMKYGNGRFDASLLTKTTLESRSTLEKYETEHTFSDNRGEKYVASWHMRFTGIPGRIFFVPEYGGKNGILICYIGKKLPNVTYPS